MCGIAGFFKPTGLTAESAQQSLDRMSQAVSHRGPDDCGTWLDSAAGIALGHRRLSIIDLSSAGHQPMISGTGRYVIALNGEIYNHCELRREIEHSDPPEGWRGHSDTEVLLAAFERWGIEASLNKAVGMFGFALWDRNNRTLTLGRDRIGEKPMYYGWQGDVLLFGSELKALRAHPAFLGNVDRRVLGAYFRRGYVAAPHCIYRDIFKLLPGSYAQFSTHEPPGHSPAMRNYWTLRDAAARGLSAPFRGSDAEAVELLEAALMRAVGQQCIADVPLGAFLSGGVDSSTIVAMMQAQAPRRVKTFTIGFEEGSHNEADHARLVATRLGTDHTELLVTARDALEVVPRLGEMFDEPFGDSSAIPTFLVSQMARRHVTVALSGDGGDELFGGYTRYRRARDIWSLVDRVPYGLRKAASSGVHAISTRKGARLAAYLGARDSAAVYEVQMLQRLDADELVVGGGECGDAIAPHEAFPADNAYSTMMYLDTGDYLPDNILVKVDRASMSVALEARVPLLDHRVVELAWQLPLRMKIRGQSGKWLLKQVLRKHLPDGQWGRPKMGFGIPTSRWLRGPLRDWADGLLSEQRLRREGFLNPGLVRAQWARHLAGDSSNSDSLWHVLAFQAWLASTV